MQQSNYPKISVCMASYNGEQYLYRQLRSILDQLGSNDELIICDDASKDSSVHIIISLNDPRIKIIRNAVNMGHVASFKEALSHASGHYIFLSDQDDIWIKDRVARMITFLEQNSYDLVVTDFRIIDANSCEIGFSQRLRVGGSRLVRILDLYLGRAPYDGCTFLMRSDFLGKVINFPVRLEAHDVWIGLLGNSIGKVGHLKDFSISRRMHQNNLTPRKRRRLSVVILTRIRLFYLHVMFLMRYLICNLR